MIIEIICIHLLSTHYMLSDEKVQEASLSGFQRDITNGGVYWSLVCNLFRYGNTCQISCQEPHTSRGNKSPRAQARVEVSWRR